MANRTSGKIVVFDFQNGQGRYITTSFDSNYDVEIEGVTPRISLRITYILKKQEVVGLKITKVGGKEQESINLKVENIKKIIEVLSLLASIDLDSIANSNLLLDESIVSDPAKLKKLLITAMSDERGIDVIADLIKESPNLPISAIREMSKRENGVGMMEKLLNDNKHFRQYKETNNIKKDEQVWQRFFEDNSWILGSDIVRIAGARGIDEHNITDIPFQSFDGFMDIIELKLPTATMWTKNNEPSQELVAAVMQCMRYIHVAEMRSNDKQKCEELKCSIVKPRAILIYGRSSNWDDTKFKILRILNDGLSNITVMTYDQVLNRAKSILHQKDGGW